MKGLIINRNTSFTGIGNVCKVIMNYSDFSWDILNISLFYKGKDSKFPCSSKGKTLFINSSNFNFPIFNKFSSILKILTGRLSEEVVSKIQGTDYDLILISAPELIFLIRNLRKSFRSRIKIIVHDLGSERLTFYSIFFRKSIERTVLVDEILVDSEKTRSNLLNFFNVKNIKFLDNMVITVWLSIDFKLYSKIDKGHAREILLLPPKVPILLSVGSPVKNLATAIKALNEIDLDDFIFLRVGPVPPDLRDLMKPNLRERTRIVTAIEDKEMPYYYNAADLLLYPSTSDGFGLEILEAIACEIPVIIANLEPMKSIAGTCALKLDDPFNFRQLAQLITHFYSNQDSILKSCNYEIIKKKFGTKNFVDLVEN